MTVPLPTWQAATGVVLFIVRHAPPSIAALASSPGGRLTVRSFGESAPVGANLTSIPRFAVDPAAVPLCVSVMDGLIDADATGANAAAANVTPARLLRGQLLDSPTSPVVFGQQTES